MTNYFSSGTTAVFATQILLTLIIAVSLRAMWNLMNVVQVVVFTRHFCNWPSNVQQLLDKLHDAMKLRELNEFLLDRGMSAYEKAKVEFVSPELLEYGIDGATPLRSLGIFLIALVIIILLCFVFFLLKTLSVRLNLLKPAVALMKKNLFYKVWIRYLI